MTVSVRQSADTAAVARAAAHPRIYPHISDDFSPPAGEVEFPLDDRFHYLEVVEGEAEPYMTLGFFVVMMRSPVVAELHTLLYPSGWGERAEQAVAAMKKWVWQNTEASRLVTEVPEGNTVALRMAERTGFKRYGLNPRSYMKGGELRDVTLLGVSRGEECP